MNTLTCYCGLFSKKKKRRTKEEQLYFMYQRPKETEKTDKFHSYSITRTYIPEIVFAYQNEPKRVLKVTGGMFSELAHLNSLLTSILVCQAMMN